MKKIIILIPVFNDWDSLKKLINEISKTIEKLKNFSFKCIIVNDASTTNLTDFDKPNNIESIKILNMIENRGHARCNAFGVRYIFKNEKFDYLILMDGDGEDRPTEINNLIEKVLENPNRSVVAKRIKRAEGFFFQFLYRAHKLITYIFTGELINFGNFSCLIKKDIEKIHSSASLWSSYSGTLKKNVEDLSEIKSIRGARYFGPSKMSLFKLLIHSLSIIAVFKKKVYLRSIIFIFIFAALSIYLGIYSLYIQILLVLFCLIVQIVSNREKKNALLKSHENLKNETIVTH